VVAPESTVDAHRAMGETLCLQSILSHVETRRVNNDYTIAWAGRRWQIPKAALRPGMRGTTIRVEARLDGTLQARIGDGFIRLRECETPVRTPEPAHSDHRSANCFNVARALDRRSYFVESGKRDCPFGAGFVGSGRGKLSTKG
jgi:hypothetical protein